MAVLRAAVDDGADLTRLTLVSTIEPCPACATTAVLFDVKGIVFGTSIQTLASLGWRQIVVNAATVSEAYTGKKVPVRGGILVAETDELSRSVPARG